MGRTLSDINHSKILYDPPPSVMETKPKINKWDLVKLKNFCTMKETRWTTSRCSQQGEKAAFRIGENNSKWSNWQRTTLQNVQAAHAAQYQKNKQPNQKVGRRTEQTFSKEDRWLTNTWQDVQHHLSLKKCKSKPQWGITSRHQSEWLPSKSPQTIKAGEGVEKSTLCWNSFRAKHSKIPTQSSPTAFLCYWHLGLNFSLGISKHMATEISFV